MANTLPVVKTSSLAATHGESFAASSLFTASDPDGDTITQYAFWDSTGNGYFVLNVEIDVPASQLTVAGYQSSSGADLLWVRANDGTGWGDWQSFTVTAPIDAPPVVTVADQAAVHGQVFAASNLFAVSDAEADTITQYDFWNIGSGGGRFVVGAIARGTNQDIYVSAAQLAQTNYRSGSGSDTLYVRAFDGFVWGAWSRAFTVTAPVDAGAVLTASDKTVAKGATIAASALFSATDSDGDTIASYQLWDSTTGSGRFVVNGIGQLSRQAINVTAAQLSQTYFQAGSNSTDDLWVRASDGYLFSNWVEFHVSAPNQLPIVTVSNQTGAPGQGISASSWFSATDADGDSMQNVQFWNSNGDAASGYFVVNGVVQGANQAIAVSAANLANASFQFGTEADQLWVRVNDGTDWSPWQSFVATPTSGIPAGNKAPVVSVGTQSATHGQSLAGSSLLSASDPDADPIIKYQFWNSTGDPAIGYFVLNGMAEPVQQSIEVTAAQLPSFSFQSGSGNDLLWVRASDGFQWSSWQSFTVTAPVDHAPVVTASDISATHRQSFAAASLFSVTDADNDTMAKYEFWDSSDPSAGQFVVNGTSEPSNQPIDVSAADLANTSFQSGSGTALLWVRANDGMLWSSWVPFHLNAPADQAPVVAGNDTAIALNQSVAVSSLFTVMDPENDPITAYEFWNSSPDPSNGYFIANAQVQPADQVIDVSAAQLGQTRFVAGSQVGETDLIWERASDGMQWSAWHSLTVTSFQPAGPPTPQFDLAPADQSGAPGSHQAQAATVTLVGHTGVNDTVALMSGDTTLATTTSSNTGAFQFANVSLVQGDNALTTKASDSSGQSSTFSLSIDRLPPSGSINAALSWNQATLAAIKQDASTPEFASRALAMESLAVFDAVSAVDGTPGYLLDMSAPLGTDANAAVAQAAHDVLAYLYPAQKATLDADLVSSLATIPDGQGKSNGITLGVAVAAKIIALRANDGWNVNIVDDGGTAIGQWQPTGPSFMPAQAPQWANLTPFAMTSPDQFQPAGPPDLSSQAYADAVNLTESLGAANSSTRTTDQTQIANFWKDGAGTFTPAGHWNSIADQIAQAQGDGLAQDARLFAELNVAEADAAIAAWNTKYAYNTWRPITAIQNADSFSNAGIVQDPNWQPLIITPNFPEYISGHSTFSAAAADILASFFGTNYAFSTTSSSLPGVTRTFTSFEEAAQEAGMSRIYGGIHFTFSNIDGQAVGQQVGDWILKAFDLSQDTVPPKIVLDETSGLVTNQNPTITGVVSDNLSGVASLAAALDGGSAMNVVFNPDGTFVLPVNLAFDGSADGAHTLVFTAIDAAGNASTPLAFSFTLATKAPQIALSAVSVQDGGTLAAGARLAGTITLESGDRLTGLSYAIDSGTKVPLAFNAITGAFDQVLDLTKVGLGNHNITLSASDAAGNATSQTLNVSLPSLPPLTVTGLTPMYGAADVGVTYHPKLTFSRPIDPSTLTGSSFYATDSTGTVVPASIVPFADNTRAFLFFTNPLPSASTITLHVQGELVKGTDGSLLDAAGTGIAGSALNESFTTVSTSTVPNTTITGIVVDPGPDSAPMTPDDVKAAADGLGDFANDTWKLPIAGVKVFVLGDEQDAVYTDGQGRFTLNTCRSGT